MSTEHGSGPPEEFRGEGEFANTSEPVVDVDLYGRTISVLEQLPSGRVAQFDERVLVLRRAHIPTEPEMIPVLRVEGEIGPHELAQFEDHAHAACEAFVTTLEELSDQLPVAGIDVELRDVLPEARAVLEEHGFRAVEETRSGDRRQIERGVTAIDRRREPRPPAQRVRFFKALRSEEPERPIAA
jgi:hypothetical protein